MSHREIWEIEVRHEGLNKYRHIRGSDQSVVEQKADAQQLAWDEMWEKKQAAEKKKEIKNLLSKVKKGKKELAIKTTNVALEAIAQLEAILAHSLSVDNVIKWSSLLDNKPFPRSEPKKPRLKTEPKEPNKLNDVYKPKIPAAPNANYAKYKPKLGLLDKIFSKSKSQKEENAKKRYLKDLDLWNYEKKKIEEKAERKYSADHKAWISKKKEIKSKNMINESKYLAKLKKWQEDKYKYEQRQEKNNKKIKELKKLYQKKESGTVSDYCKMVLMNSKYPDYFPQKWDVFYQAESKVLIVDYSLPDIDSLPTLKKMKYIISRDEFTETHLSSAALNKLYDVLLYQIALRTIHELYEADIVNALDSIVFNGWVDSVDKATGKNVNSCIMSLQASKDEFLAINLEKIDPRACFKQLKGVGSSKLHGLSPVAPIISIDKEDRRFTSAYTVIDEVADSDNLAAMDWQDFENLIREIFEKEFVSSGGEVKITQASRDGGVDAVAFDPDPIRGGKIIIQAKRYTNVVGVSAVRDLYGTTVNEGANKGILVTTADYGADAYEFAKGKPLTLLNGGNLLHLLQKHGHKAKIDLKEAKKILAEQKI